MDLHSLVSKLKELARELNKTPTLREFVNYGVSKRQIQNYKFSEIVRAAGLEPNKHAQTTSPVEVIIRPPRVLIFDLEVCAATAYTYQFRDAYIAPEQIITMPYILSYAAKWLGEDTIYYLDTRYSPKDDLQILDGLNHLLEQADYVVGHNMRRFDLPMTKGRMIIRSLDPIKDLGVIDTFKIAFKHFKFPFYKLGELAKYLGCNEQKSSHAKFPGNTLFIEADKGNMEAFEEMEDYCKKDVLVTEEVLKKLMPWEPSINFQANYHAAICSCGSREFYKNGIKYNKQSAFQMYRCHHCKKTFIAKENLIDKDLRKGFMK
jgi:DNA polymerase elongation subunit (family B)